MQPTTALFAAALAIPAAIFVFFFFATRGTLIVRGLVRRVLGRAPQPDAHVYPLYSDRRLMQLVDRQPIISAILLFQYHRLVSRIVEGLRASDLRGKTVLITSCAYGNVMQRVVDAAVDAGAARVLVADIIQNQLTHARAKLERHRDRVEFVTGDATAMSLPEGCADANIIFFLLHELPHEMKGRAMGEAGRMLAAGGTLYLAEFHRPRHWSLRMLSWIYFQVFEPLGLALWDREDPLKHLERMRGWQAQRQTCCFGNYQVVTATKD